MICPDSAQLNFNPQGLFILNLCLALVMFGVALDIRLSDFRRLAGMPRAVIAGLLSQWLVLPVLSVGLVLGIDRLLDGGLCASLALGMLLVASCPGGNVSNFLVHFGRGNAALSVSLTTLSSLGAMVITPTLFAIAGRLSGMRLDGGLDIQLDVANMVVTIAIVVAIPLLLGVWLAERRPELARRLQRPARIVSLLVLAAFVGIATLSNIEATKEYIGRIFWIVILHNALALSAGYTMASLFSLPVYDRRAITLETGIQNSGLALVLIFTFFGGQGGMALIAAWWGIWHLVSGFAIATFWRRHPPASS